MDADPSGCLHAWRVLDVLVPDPADQRAVVERFGDLFEGVARSGDPRLADVTGSQRVRGGVVHVELYVIGADDQGNTIGDPADPPGYFSFWLIPEGGASGDWHTPRPDSSARAAPASGGTDPYNTAVTACGGTELGP